MRKISVFLVPALALVFGFAVVAAQEGTPATTDVHPFVGTWLLDTDVDHPENWLEVAVITADGGYTTA